MNHLSKNWLTEGLIDFEYKKYVLLAYLKDIRTNFQNLLLYPFLGDLYYHYKTLSQLKENKQLIFDHFPKRISKADFEKLELIYENLIEDDKVMQEIESIIAFALPKLENSLNEGKDIYEYVENNLSITPVGIRPLDTTSGYIFIHSEDFKDVLIFEYQMSIFQNSEENYRGLNTRFVKKISKSIGNTFESIKVQLIQNNRSLPNPGTYLITSSIGYPFEETLFPIAKRKLMRYIAEEAA
jgi:hypothetical protein